MTLSNQELLEKATLTTADFGGVGEAPLTLQTADRFIRLMSLGQDLLNDVRLVRHTAAKWQEPIIDFGSRIARPGTQGARLSDGDRVKPTTSMIEMSTVLLRGEVPIADEVLEDNPEGRSINDTLETMIADRFGYDVEELLLNGDTGSGDAYLAQLDGWLKQATGAGGHVTNAAAYGKDYQAIFSKLLQSIPARFKRRIEQEGRFYVPNALIDFYRDIISQRGTALGDLSLQSDNQLRYHNIAIVGVSTFPTTAGTPDTSYVLLTQRSNLLYGVRRVVNIETFRDPREGATSFIVTTRVDAKIQLVDATAVATNVDVEP